MALLYHINPPDKIDARLIRKGMLTFLSASLWVLTKSTPFEKMKLVKSQVKCNTRWGNANQDTFWDAGSFCRQKLEPLNRKTA